MGHGRRFARLPDGELKACAAGLVEVLHACTGDDRDAVLDELSDVRHEMVSRLDAGHGDAGSGVREPRRPRPSSDGAALAPPAQVPDLLVSAVAYA